MLRPVFAICLLVTHLFNMGGYRLVFDRLEQKASVQLADRLDQDLYTDDQLIELKVPLPMPYQTNWDSFERYNGEIQIDGIHYNYVKRKVWNDTLILLCIPNTEKMKLNSAREQFFSLVNDLDPQNEGTPVSPVRMLKSITPDYIFEENLHSFCPPLQDTLVLRNNVEASYLGQTIPTDVPPPEQQMI